MSGIYDYGRETPGIVLLHLAIDIALILKLYNSQINYLNIDRKLQLLIYKKINRNYLTCLIVYGATKIS